MHCQQKDKETMLRFYRQLERGSYDVAEERYAPACNIFTSEAERSGIWGVQQAFLAAFPDGKIIDQARIAEGSTAANGQRYRTTPAGEFRGIPPSGKQVTMKRVDICRFAGGKAVEKGTECDRPGMLEQAGPAAAPGDLPSGRPRSLAGEER